MVFNGASVRALVDHMGQHWLPFWTYLFLQDGVDNLMFWKISHMKQYKK
jgi:hypothetical protein